jgi:arylsulfatase
VFLLVPAQGIVADYLGTFVDFPPRMKAASFTIDQVQERLEAAIASGR